MKNIRTKFVGKNNFSAILVQTPNILGSKNIFITFMLQSYKEILNKYTAAKKAPKMNPLFNNKGQV